MIRKVIIFASVAAAVWVGSYGLDVRNMILWAGSALWISIVILAQLWPIKKKRHRKSNDTLQNQVERNINFAETQLK